MPLRPSSFLAVLGLFAITTPSALAQEPSACECTDLGAESFHAPDTIFHVTKGFAVAYCGKIDRSVAPFVYSEFTMRSCGLVHVPLQARGTLQACHLSVSHSLFIVEGLALLPTGADMHLERGPCWRTAHWLFVAEDSSASAIAGPITELIATFQKPTAEQVAQVQARLEAMKSSVYWTDDELLGHVFLCALFDPTWAGRFRNIRETYRWGGTNAELYDEFLKILHERRK